MTENINSAGILSRKTLEMVATIIHDESISQRDCQYQKMVLTEYHSKSFCPLNVFKRIDRDGKGFINSLDLVVFFRDNGKVIPEADTFMLVGAFDTNLDGRLSLLE